MEKVTDDFAAWKNMVVSGFTYYRILPVINGTHRPPSPTTEALQFQYFAFATLRNEIRAHITG